MPDELDKCLCKLDDMNTRIKQSKMMKLNTFVFWVEMALFAGMILYCLAIGFGWIKFWAN